jgi:hypothetical protein
MLIPAYPSWQWRGPGLRGCCRRCIRGRSFCGAHQCVGGGSSCVPSTRADAHGRWSTHPASWGSPVCRCLQWCGKRNPEQKFRLTSSSVEASCKPSTCVSTLLHNTPHALEHFQQMSMRTHVFIDTAKHAWKRTTNLTYIDIEHRRYSIG